MTTLTCTITKNGRSDEFGRALTQGQSYTGAFDFVRALYMAGYCSVSDDSVFDDDQWPNETAPGNVTAVQNPATGGIASLNVSGTKVVDLEYGDNLTNPSATTTLTAAVSTTAALSATASGTYRKARVSWINNGASASAKLYVSVNAENDVQGLVASQLSRRRDHEMTMGDAVMLVCDFPITRLTFSSDVSITSNTHRLIVTFGE